MSEKELAVIGSAEVVKPFLVLGVRCLEINDSQTAKDELIKINAEQKVGIIFIAESLAEKIMDYIEKVKLQELPAVFILPEYGSKKELGLKRLEKIMAKAIGKKIVG